MEWIRRQKFRALLIALVVVVLVYPVFQEFTPTRLLFDSLRTVCFMATLLVVFDAKHQRILAFAVGIPTLVAAWLYPLLENPVPLALEFAFHTLSAIFFTLAVYTILRAVYRDDEITSESVYGSFCSYMLIGVIFGHLYCIMEAWSPNSFRVEDERIRALFLNDRGHQILTYFSFMTITTVGYGDIIPVTPATRALATVEAVLGQFYIAVLVAELIGKRVSQSVDNRHSENPDA